MTLGSRLSGAARGVRASPWRPCVAALMVILTVSCGGSASRAGVVLFDNLSAGSPNGDFGVTNSQWVAQAFSTTATGYVLDEVSLRLWNQNGTTGNFEIQVWDALGPSGRPGAQVGSAIYTGQAASLGDSTSLLTIPGLSVALGANTPYYLVTRGTTLTEVGPGFRPSPGYLAWNATDVIASNSYDTGNGSSWSGPYTQNLYMKVTAVPEPSTEIMIGAALAAWVIRRHRRAWFGLSHG